MAQPGDDSARLSGIGSGRSQAFRFLPDLTLQDTDRHPAWSQGWDWLFILLLMLVNVLALMHSSTMADLNRDLAETLRILRGEWVTAGPAIAQRMHNGPVWFYVLSVPLWISRQWWLVTLWSGLLIASVWPLVYLLGRQLHGRQLGLGFAAAMALPGWFSTYDYVYSHPALIPAMTAATLLAIAWWWQQPGLWRLLVTAFIGALAMHAHFSTFGLLLFLLFMLLVQMGQGRGSLTYRVLAMPVLLLGLLIPWAPYLLDQGQAGFTELSSAAGYLGGFQPWENLQDLPATLFGYLLKGPWFALVFLADWQRWLAAVLAGLMVLLCIIGIVPWLRMATLRSPAMAAWVLLLGIVFIGTLLIREFTPFYQVLSLHVLLAGTLAIGWLAWMRKHDGLLVIVMLLAAVIQVAEWRSIADKAGEGVVFAPWSSLAILEQVPWGPLETRWWLAADHRDGLASGLCDTQADDALLLGHLGAAVAVDGGVTVQMQCGDQAPRLWFQQASGNPVLLAGISQFAAEALQLPRQDHADGFHRLARVRYQSLPAKAVPLARDYPPVFERTGQGAYRQFALESGEILAVVNPLQSFLTLPEPRLNWQGEALQPVFEDGESYFYRCPGCTAGQPVNIELSPEVSDWVQVFAFPAGNSTAHGSTVQTAIQ